MILKLEVTEYCYNVYADINECREYEDYILPYTNNDVRVKHIHLCHGKATCLNTIGSFHCKCNPGYYGDGKYCVSEKHLSTAMKSKW